MGFAIEIELEVLSVAVGKFLVLKITEVSPRLDSSGINSVTSVKRAPTPISMAPDSANGVAES